LKKRDFSVDDLCLLSIAESDNTAANKLIDLVGGIAAVNKFIKGVGLLDTEITHKFMLHRKEDPSTTSLRDLLRFLTLLLEKKLKGSQRLKDYMLEQKNRFRTAFYIKDAYGLKTADLPHPEAVLHDAGIIFNREGDIIFVILSEGVRDRKEAVLEFQKLAKEVYDRILWEERPKKELSEVGRKIASPIKGPPKESYEFGKEVVYDGKSWGVHLGQDYTLKAGSGVFAAADGKVVYSSVHLGSKKKRNWGNIVIVAHKLRGKIVFTLYGHLGQRAVKKGERVRLGEKLGSIGAGNSKENGYWEPHLHFAVFGGQYDGSVLPGYDPPGNRKDWMDPGVFLGLK